MSQPCIVCLSTNNTIYETSRICQVCSKNINDAVKEGKAQQDSKLMAQRSNLNHDPELCIAWEVRKFQQMYPTGTPALIATEVIKNIFNSNC